MQQFLCIHTFGPGSISREQIQQFSQIAQQAQDVHGMHSYLNLSEGKAVCIFEADSKAQLERFFGKMGMPFDTICPVEVEGERGILHDVTQQTTQQDIHPA
jgi:hypothetical protein